MGQAMRNLAIEGYLISEIEKGMYISHLLFTASEGAPYPDGVGIWHSCEMGGIKGDRIDRMYPFRVKGLHVQVIGQVEQQNGGPYRAVEEFDYYSKHYPRRAWPGR